MRWDSRPEVWNVCEAEPKTPKCSEKSKFKQENEAEEKIKHEAQIIKPRLQ